MSQINDILEYMVVNGRSGITSLQAIKKYGATRLSDVIFKLKARGWNIKDEWLTVSSRYGKKRVKRYWL